VAKALQVGSYSPAESKRIRAVPDTRTIRYYTTLGLIDRPAEMRGRTAMYEPHHVMQIVAIKRLQAANQSLSDVQERLLGITKKQLTKLADLPDGFWESADRYLSRKTTKTVEPVSQEDEPREFWNEPPALPDAALPVTTPITAVHETPMVFSSRSASAPDRALRRCMSWEPMPGVKLLIEGAADDTSIDLSRLQDAAVPLLNELLRQGLLKAASLPPEVSP
jgi:DNA-binding transcriptional MerR regulator